MSKRKYLTAEAQRIYSSKKRVMESDEPLVKCLECGLMFVRVGSHVVQVHGYESALEYRREHGLMARETRTAGYAAKMRAKARNYDNLENGASTRFVKGGDHPEMLKNFWDKWHERGVKR